jgi:hypothetical protein
MSFMKAHGLRNVPFLSIDYLCYKNIYICNYRKKEKSG